MAPSHNLGTSTVETGGHKTYCTLKPAIPEKRDESRSRVSGPLRLDAGGAPVFLSARSWMFIDRGTITKKWAFGSPDLPFSSSQFPRARGHCQTTHAHRAIPKLKMGSKPMASNGVMPEIGLILVGLLLVPSIRYLCILLSSLGLWSQTSK